MKLEELPVELTAAKKAVDTQQAYVTQLTDLYNKGQQTIKVFDEKLNLWTVISLPEFFTIQNNKLIALMQYHGNLNGIYNSLQQLLDESLASVLKPA